MKHWALLLCSLILLGCFPSFGKGGTNDALYAAVARADLAQARQLMARDPKVSLHRNDLLRLAAITGQPEAVELFLAKGADVNDNANRTLLAHLAQSRVATDESCAQVANILLAHGAVVDAEDYNGWTALQWAVESRHSQLANVLLAHGADLSRRESGVNKGMTLLHKAVRRNDAATVAVLLKFNAPLDVVDGHGATPLLLAEELNETNIAALLTRADPKAPDATRTYLIPPDKDQMRALPRRIAAGDEAALDELAVTAQKLYGEIKDYRREEARVMLLLFRMTAAFDVLGDEAGRGNTKALEALKHCLAQHPLSAFAPDALGIAAAAGNKEALGILQHYQEWGILESQAQEALQRLHSSPAPATSG
jgi:hypothetical protein